MFRYSKNSIGGATVKKTKAICVILCLTVLISLSGCGFIHGITSRTLELDLLTSKGEKANLDITNKVLNAFNEKDSNALKSLLCLRTQELTDIDKQICDTFDFFNGNVTSFNKEVEGSENDSKEDGEQTFLGRSWSVNEIYTDTGESYELYIRQAVIDKNDKSREGISEIDITNKDGTELIIGYSWPSYYSDAQDLSVKVIKALSEKDTASLKSVFCSKTQTAADFDNQIQSAFDFFKGKATFGKVGTSNGHDLYDGKHDFRTTVADKEVVNNHAPICTFITVHNENIETDASKIYKLEFYAYLLNNGDETYQGISQITITSNDGKKLVIGEKLD